MDISIIKPELDQLEQDTDQYLRNNPNCSHYKHGIHLDSYDKDEQVVAREYEDCTVYNKITTERVTGYVWNSIVCPNRPRPHYIRVYFDKTETTVVSNYACPDLMVAARVGRHGQETVWKGDGPATLTVKVGRLEGLEPFKVPGACCPAHPPKRRPKRKR